MRLGNTGGQYPDGRAWRSTVSDMFRESSPPRGTAPPDRRQPLRRRRRPVPHSATSSAIEWPSGPIGTGSLVADHRSFAVRRMINIKIIFITNKVRTRKASTWQPLAAGSDRAEYLATSLQQTPISVITEMTPTRESPDHGRLSGPIWFVEKLLKTWRLERGDAVPLLGLEPSDLSYATDVFAGRATLRGRDAKDRIAYLFRIRKTLSALFRDEDVENEWLRERHEMLDDKAPMDLLLDGSMENLLLVKEYVEAAAGR